ncbi:MAG: ribonuclease III [Eubacterium sp.]|nr:ribonuclease III [Eubacterium sp.]
MKEKDLLEEIHSYFPGEEVDIRSYAPLKLAYLGDAVYEIIVRTLIMESVGGPVKNLHKASSELVNAGAQAKLVLAMVDELTEEELAAYRHGRNAKTSSVAKHADIHDYRNATGLEALFGYLYMTNHTERAIELLKIAMEKTGMEVPNGRK